MSNEELISILEKRFIINEKMHKEIKWDDVLRLVITISKDDPYHASKLTSPERIYKNR